MTKTFFDLRSQLGSHKYIDGRGVACIIYAHSKLSLFNDLDMMKELFDYFQPLAISTPAKQVSWVLQAVTKLERENSFQAEINTKNVAKNLIIPLRKKVKHMHPQTADLIQNCMAELGLTDTILHEKFDKFKKLPKYDPRIGSGRWG